MARAIKQADEKLTFVYDFSDLIGNATLVGLPLDPPSAVPRGGGAALVMEGDPVVNETSVIIKWTGGDPGESYLTTVRMADSGGDLHDRDGEIYVVDKQFTVPENLASRYLTAEEYVARYGTAETIRLTDEDRRGVVDAPKLEAAIGDATETADAYIGTRYTTPLLGVPRIVKTIVAALARESLHKTKPTPEVKDRAELARQQLRDIAAGRMMLPVEQGAEEPVLGGNRIAETSNDSSSSFRDAVSEFGIDAGSYLPNWRR